MSLLRPPTTQVSPFSEIRQIERNKTLAVIAASTVVATSCLITAVLVALGVLA
ncbi:MULTISPECIES: hypothetical protein [unclassified Frondihabitans]|jgi:hypothetical protein|uniref:hypothetical protein n=1 Tax=unclassified Frondihabitans TaxID=2626248 RepID=UPI0012F82BD6|nr:MULTISPECIES: hypothetical protein [unclassified Frondihabitans]MBF4576955.1 hypothetical protein [Frondihabitans sp. VKM Ac-2883]